VAAENEIEPSLSLSATRGWVIAHRMALFAGSILGLIVGIAVAMLRPAYYVASTTVLVSSGPSADLTQIRGLASQFGLAGALGGRGEEFPPDLVAKLAKSSSLLLPIVRERVPQTVRNAGGRTLIDLLKAKPRGGGDASDEERMEVDAVRKLEKLIDVAVDRKTRAISLNVKTRWPDVSAIVATRLTVELDSIIFDFSRQRAVAERRSTEARMAPQEQRLKVAESRVAGFVRANREYRLSPERTFEFDRLEREVQLQEQVLVSLAQSREQAAAREAQSAPSLAVVERVTTPVLPEPRQRILIVLGSIVVGLCIGVIIAYVRDSMRSS
jgi:uncharacterized protein involved in exopolysaccharide biosynthesis